MSSFPGRLKAVLAVAVLALLAGGVSFYRVQERRVRQDVESSLQAIAELKANQIANWRFERLGDASTLTENALLGPTVAKWMETSDAGERETLLACFRSLHKNYRYDNVLLVDIESRVRLNLSGKQSSLPPELAQALSAALRDHKPVFSDLHMDEFVPSPYIGVVAPLFVGRGETQRPVGAVVLVCDARRFLYPLIQSWPEPSKTAETLLVRRDGNDALFLNELRHQTNAALKLRFPLSQTNVPAVMAVLGKEGIAQGADYRGVEVISAIRHVPDSPWFLVAKMDKAEAFADWQFRSGLILVLLLALVILASAVVLVLWQRNQKAHYRALYRAEAAQLASEKRYGVTLKSIGDAVIATDNQGRVELLNPVAEMLTGWRDEEARGKPVEEVFRVINEDTRQPVENPVTRVRREGMVVGLANHTALIARDGTERPIADAGAPIRDEKNEIIGMVLVFREQTEERAMHRVLRENERKYRELVQNANSIILRWNAKGCITFLNEFAQIFFGYAEREILGRHVVGAIVPETESTGRDLRSLIEQIGVNPDAYAHNVNENICRDGRRVWIAWNNKAVFDAQGRLVEVFSVGNDITERKQAEKALEKSEEKHRVLIETTATGFVIVDEKGCVLDANDEYVRLTGHEKREQILGRCVTEWTAAYDQARNAGEVKTCIASGFVRGLEIDYVHPDGTVVPIEVNASTLNEGGRLKILTLCRDITERKRAEKRLEDTLNFNQTMLRASPVGIVVFKASGPCVSTNEALAQLLGGTFEEIRRQNFRQLESWKRSGLLEAAEAALATQSERKLETRFVTTFGKEVWLSFHLVPYDYEGEAHLLLLVADIAERKRAEEALRESEKKLHAVLDATPFPIAVVDLQDDKILFWSHSALALFGHTAPTASEWYQIAYPDPNYRREVIERWKPFLETARQSHQSVNTGEYRVACSDGSVRICELYATFLADSLIVTFNDITKRKQAEVALQNSQALYHSLVENLPQHIFRKDREGRFLFVNERSCQDAGLSPADFIGKTDADFFPPELAQAYRQDDLRVMETGQVLDQEEKHVELDGRESFVHVIKTPLRDAQGRITGIQGVFWDVTERKRAEEAVKESRQMLRSVLDTIPVRVFWKDLAGRYVGCNHPFARDAGFDSPEALVGKDDYAMGWKDQADLYRADDRKVITGGVPKLYYEEPQTTPVGKQMWLRTSKIPLRDLEGRIVGILGAYEDITESKRAEEALRESQMLYQSFVEQLPTPVFRKDSEGRFVMVNSRFCRLKGMKAEDFIGKKPLAAAASETARQDKTRRTAKYAAIGEETHEQIMRTGKIIEMEEEYSLADGGKQFLHVVRMPVFDPAGKIIGTQGIQFDITERKRAEEHIREQSALLDSANDAIYVRALDHTVTYWNDGAERLYGWTRAEALGRKITDLGNVDHKAYVAAHATLLEQGSWSGELKKTGKEGKERVVFCRWTLLRDESGRPKEILAINTDITERKQLEANFLRAQRMEGIGALAGGIAHDLNNILQPILMAVPLLRETAGDSESREMLDTVETCAQRGADIIKQLLTFARGTPEVRVPLPVRHLLSDVNKIIRETFPRNIQLTIDAPKDLWPVLGDATQIHQALMNLCVNARDAMPDGGTLVLEAKNLTLDETFAAMTPEAKPGTYVYVSVTDTGTGIPSEHLNRIFDPFFTTKEIGKGTGLGLTTVLGIVRGHGGFVRVNSRVGHGTTFELYFPASPKARTAGKSDNETLPPEMHGELILVVDDEASVREVIQQTLEKHGYRVVTAAEGSKAMALFAQHRAEIKAVITDLMMPGMDGPSLILALRQLEPRLPILSMTGLGEQPNVKGIHSLSLPGLLKPFAKGELLAALHQAIAVAAQPGRKAK